MLMPTNHERNPTLYFLNLLVNVSKCYGMLFFSYAILSPSKSVTNAFRFGVQRQDSSKKTALLCGGAVFVLEKKRGGEPWQDRKI